MSHLYGLIRLLLRAVNSIYFKKISVIGIENVPKDGPLIICGNHANQFIDPMMLITKCPRDLSFCMAASSYSKSVVGYLAKKINVIPVYRPEDGKVEGDGKIKLKSATELIGIGTAFLTKAKSFPLGLSTINIDKKYSAVVEKIISETEILIRRDDELVSAWAKEAKKEFSFFYIPKMDNTTMFKQAYEQWDNGNAVCIFPEGTSHDRTDFLKLKAGVALMGLGAMAQNGTKNIKIMPAGWTYFHRDEFRSEVIVEFGVPFEIPEKWGELFKTNKRDAIEKTWKEIELRMKAVTVRAPSFKEYSCISWVRELYIPKELSLSPAQYSELCKRFSQGYELVKDWNETKKWKRNISNYIDELDNAGWDDNEVKLIYYSYGYFVRKTIASFLLFHVYLLTTLPMIAITAPFVWTARKKAEKERLVAKAKNPNKVEALDVVSSVKIAHFLQVLPLVFLLWVALMHLFFNYYLITLTEKRLSWYSVTVIASLTFPVYAYLGTLMIDQLFFYLHTMKTRFLFFCYPKNVYRLKANRSKLESEVAEYVNSHIKVTDFSNDRIIMPYCDADQLKRMKDKKRTNKEWNEFLNKFNLNS